MPSKESSTAHHDTQLHNPGPQGPGLFAWELSPQSGSEYLAQSLVSPVNPSIMVAQSLPRIATFANRYGHGRLIAPSAGQPGQ